MPYIVLDPTLAEPAPAVAAGDPLTSVGMTLLDLRSELRKMLGNRQDVDDPRLTLFVNEGYIDLAASLQLDDLTSGYGFQTVVGQALYGMPPAARATLGASVVDSVTYPEFGGLALNKTDLNEYRTLRDASDEPTRYFRQAGLMVLWPTPSAIRTVAVDFRIRPQALVADTDSPILAYEWHMAILLNARRWAFSALLEFDKAMAAENDIVTLIRKRSDTKAEEDENKVILSSVPRSRRMLRRSIDSGLLDNPDLL